jgi:RNA polymerase sigma factor (sigma-70 family)
MPIDTSDDQRILELSTADDGVELSLLSKQQHDMIAQAIAALPHKERASLLLRDVEGLSTEAVAQALRSSATTVRSQISSARRKIRDYCRRRTMVTGGRK